ncbi:MAG: hypothetical protein H7833_07990 [Magnetococcus sp. DMHC-1]|nr:hypothetical protein [Magnetococcales bacterium]MBF0154894.1 hypothetical protein [Magnetococcales bacterium]
MLKQSLTFSGVACALSLLVLLTPAKGGTACESSECFQKQATEIDILARKRKTDQAQKKKEFEDLHQYESLRIEAMETTASIYKSIAEIHDICKKSEGRDKIAEIMNQLNKIQMRDQDKDKAKLAKKYLQNARKALEEAQVLCKGT